MSDVIFGLPFEKYQRLPGINRSALAEIFKTPADCLHAIQHPNRKETPSLKFGRLVHLAVLEPQVFQETIKFLPEIHGRDKAGRRRATASEKEFEEKLRADNPGCEFIDFEEWQTISMIAKNCHRHSIIGPAIKEGYPEVTLVWQHNGIDCKARLDLLCDSNILDLKTTTDVHEFKSSVYSWGYHYQAAWYLWGAKECGLNCQNFIFFAVDKNPPYNIKTIQLSPSALELAHHKNLKALELYKQCQETNSWPGYPEVVETVELPGYLMSEFTEMKAKEV